MNPRFLGATSLELEAALEELLEWRKADRATALLTQEGFLAYFLDRGDAWAETLLNVAREEFVVREAMIERIERALGRRVPEEPIQLDPEQEWEVDRQLMLLLDNPSPEPPGRGHPRAPKDAHRSA
jgi:hypothetical protein